MSHIIIIRGKDEEHSGEYGGNAFDFQWEPSDTAPVDEQVAQFRKMLKLYLKARHVANPSNPDPGDG